MSRVYRCKFFTHFIIGKAKAAPARLRSIHKLKLAAFFGSLVAFFMKQQLDVTIGKTTFWSDSARTLKWIYNSKEKQKKLYVANRVDKNLEASSPSNWRHTPGVFNSADDGTRQLKLQEFTPECRWFNGPLFLEPDPTKWLSTNLPYYPLAATTALSEAIQPLIDTKEFSCI